MNDVVRYVLLKKQDTSKPALIEELYEDEVYGSFDVGQAAAHQAWMDGTEVVLGEVQGVSWDLPLCSYLAGFSHSGQPEFCEKQSALGSEYCTAHSKQVTQEAGSD